METIQYNESYPNSIKCSEIVIAGTGHRDETELAEGLEEQAVGDPYAGVSDEQDTHNQAQSAQEHQVSEVLESGISDENIALADHLP